MGLFSNTTVDRAIASLFGRKTKQEDLLKAKEQVNEPVKPAVEQPKSGSEPEQTEIPEPELEDKYVQNLVRKQASVDGKAGNKSGEENKEAAVAGETSSDEESDEISEDDEADESRSQADATEDTSVGDVTEDTTGDVSEDSAEKLLEDKSENTIFVKNVPNAVVTDRKVFKQFKKLFGPNIQSVRFRSIAMSEIVPRKVAFIKQKLNPDRDSVNCYIVYKSKDRMFEVLNELNGHEFMDHHLFVDSASNPRAQVAGQSVFIGNLSFDATEEQLFRMFEDCGPIENLRIVRDRKFNIGKGFAYVQFADVSTVQLALLKNGKDFAGRPLRVTRCSKKQKPARHSSRAARTPERSFKQKQTARSRKGNPRRETGAVLEGERAKSGEKIQLGRKRKARHESQTKPKRSRK